MTNQLPEHLWTTKGMGHKLLRAIIVLGIVMVVGSLLVIALTSNDGWLLKASGDQIFNQLWMWASHTVPFIVWMLIALVALTTLALKRPKKWLWFAGAIAAVLLVLSLNTNPDVYATLFGSSTPTRSVYVPPKIETSVDICLTTPYSIKPEYGKPRRVDSKLERINPDKCDVTFAVVSGTLELTTVDGTKDIIPSNDTGVGRRKHEIYTFARGLGGQAEFYLLLCPSGKGPLDGGWECRS